MPKSKKNQVVSLTKTEKRATKERRSKLIDELRELAEANEYIWVFAIDHFRNQHVQEIRKAWKPSRILMGRNAVMRVALGSSPESECRPGCSKLAEVRWFDALAHPAASRW